MIGHNLPYLKEDIEILENLSPDFVSLDKESKGSNDFVRLNAEIETFIRNRDSLIEIESVSLENEKNFLDSRNSSPNKKKYEWHEFYEEVAQKARKLQENYDGPDDSGPRSQEEIDKLTLEFNRANMDFEKHQSFLTDLEKIKSQEKEIIKEFLFRFKKRCTIIERGLSDLTKRLFKRSQIKSSSTEISGKQKQYFNIAYKFETRDHESKKFFEENKYKARGRGLTSQYYKLYKSRQKKTEKRMQNLCRKPKNNGKSV